jgi:drug/metabolite transporter (DMT)-like permease
LKKTNKSLSLLTASIFLQSFSLLCIKLSTLQSGHLSLALLLLAIVFIGLRSTVWQYLLKITELSRIYPYASLVQVLILLYAVILFKEPVTASNIIGLGMMLSGIFYMSRKVTE